MLIKTSGVLVFLLEKPIYCEKQEKKHTADTRIQSQVTLYGICDAKVAVGQVRHRVLLPSLPVPHHRYSMPIYSFTTKRSIMKFQFKR